MGIQLNLKAGVDIRNHFFFFYSLKFWQKQYYEDKHKKNVTGSVYYHGASRFSVGGSGGHQMHHVLSSRGNRRLLPRGCLGIIPDAPNTADQPDPKIITIKECADDEKCLYYTFKSTWGQQVGRFCANEAEYRRGIEEKRWKKTYGYKGLECYKGKQKDTRTCFKICDTDHCNASAYQEEAIELESETLLETKKTEKTKTKETKTKKTKAKETKTKKTKTKDTKKTLLETLLETYF